MPRSYQRQGFYSGEKVRIHGGLHAGHMGSYVGKSDQIPGGHKIKVSGGNIYHVENGHARSVGVAARTKKSGQDDAVLGSTSGKHGGHAGYGR
jgi:hypothetical protein